MVGRVQLIKSVIQGMLVHSFYVYSWPASLIKDLEKWMRNFIWSVDVTQRKLVTVAWHIVCSSFSEGGLGIRSLSLSSIKPIILNFVGSYNYLIFIGLNS
jgi:hypothetical protein